MPRSVITVVEMCRHRHSLRFIKFCRCHWKVTWIQLKGRGQATFLKEVAFDLNLRDEQGNGQMKGRHEAWRSCLCKRQ